MDDLDRLYDNADKGSKPDEPKADSASPPSGANQRALIGGGTVPPDGAEEDDGALSRRQMLGAGVIGAGLLGVGAVAGWLASRSKYAYRAANIKRKRKNRNERLDIGVDPYFKVDPKLLRYEPAGEFDAGFTVLRRVSVGPDGSIYVCGDREVHVFDQKGKRKLDIKPVGMPHCLEFSPDGRIFMAEGDRISIYKTDGKNETKWEKLGTKVYMTALTFGSNDLYVADARAREVVRYDLEGKELDRFGKEGDGRNNPGIKIPSPYFDLQTDSNGSLHLINPGRHRVEVYSPDGRYQTSWGKSGIAVEKFCGCCNPVYMTLLPDGGYLTSEKGILRVKVHDAAGTVTGLVAGPDQFMANGGTGSTNYRLNKGMDLALDAEGKVWVSCPYTRTIKCFKPMA